MTIQKTLDNQPQSRITRIALSNSELPTHGAQQVDSLAFDQEIDFSVHLRCKTAGDSSLTTEELTTEELTTEELTTEEQDAEDLSQVRSFLNDYGLTIHEADVTTHLVHTHGTIANVSRAFGVYLGIYRHSDYDRHFRGYHGPITIPASLDGIIVAVNGLDDCPS